LQFFQPFPLQRFRKHESIIREGDTFDKIYYLKSGFVRLYTLTKSGKEISFHIYSPGDIFPSFLTFAKSNSTHYFEAVSPITEVYSAPKKKFDTFAKNTPGVLSDLTLRAGKIMDMALKHFENIISESSYNNVRSTLVYLCSIYQPYFKDKSICEIPCSHQEIASWINTTRETVTRQIQKLAEKHLIEATHRHVIIKNIRSLENDNDEI